jgi:hypothetical protein
VTFEAIAAKLALTPSITTWTRLEPLPRDGSMARSLQAQVRDPLWMLCRQWQVGEFLGDDAGSPVQATLATEQQNVTTYRPGTDDASTVVLDPALPVETHVEREKAVLRLKGSVQSGLYFENLIRQGGISGPDAVIAAFRAAFPVSPSPPDPAYSPTDALRYRSLVAGKVTDGEALYATALALAAGQSPAQPMPPQATQTGMPALIQQFTAYRASLFTEPSNDPAWQGDQLDYAFGLGSPTPGNNLLLEAPEFPGGHVDWYSFSLATATQNTAATNNPATVTAQSFNFLPNHVTFRGMPDPRWWNFEDGVTDFGQLDAQHVDLAKLLVMEFAFIFGNDWFSVPVPVPIGTLNSVTTLVVTDTFGFRTLIRPSEQTTVAPGESPWSMFKLSGPGTRSDFLLMAPTVGVVDDGPDLEQVLLLRDDMSAMAWAVEQKLQGDLDTPLDSHEMYLERLRLNPPTPPPSATTGGPPIYYTLERPAPDNWIPMVPVQTPAGELFLRRGTMPVPTSSGLLELTARALVLEPGQPFFIADRTLLRSGINTARYFRRTRSSDGSTYVWMARQSGPGKGPGWSGLAFDLVSNMGKAPGS